MCPEKLDHLTSFKHGDKEYEKDGRYFNCYDEKSINKLINKIGSIKLIKSWTTNDTRIGRENEHWLNCLVKKNNH